MLSHDAWVRLLFLNADTLLNAFLYQKKKDCSNTTPFSRICLRFHLQSPFIAEETSMVTDKSIRLFIHFILSFSLFCLFVEDCFMYTSYRVIL